MRRTLKRMALLNILLTVVACGAVLAASAAETLPPEYGALGSALTDGSAALMPNGLFSDDADSVAEAAGEGLSVRYLARSVIAAIGERFGSAARIFAALCVLIAISALVSAVCPGDAPAAKAAATAARFALAVSSLGLFYEKIKVLRVYFSELTAVMSACLPVMSCLYVAGGNVNVAAVNNATTVFMLDLTEILTSSVITPCVCVCLAAAFSDLIVGHEGAMSGVGDVSKRILTFVLGLSGTLLAASLSAQNALSSAKDTVGTKTVKYISGSAIPIVGATVGDALRTVAQGVRFLRSAVGASGICVLLLAVIPVLAELLLSRLAFSSAAAVGDMLGRRGEARFIRECASLCGYLTAAVALCGVLFVLVLTIFALSAVAAA